MADVEKILQDNPCEHQRKEQQTEPEMLLDLHVKWVIGCKMGGWVMSEYHDRLFCLPNGTKHGTAESWSIVWNTSDSVRYRGQFSELQTDVSEENRPYNEYHGYITEPEKQEQAMETIRQKGSLVMEGCYHFGTLHGPSKQFYRLWETRKWSGVTSIVEEEQSYCDGQLHGEVRYYTNRGKLSKVSSFQHGKLEGIMYEWRIVGPYRIPSFKTTYKEGQRHGEREVYDIIDIHLELSAVKQRNHWKNNALDGIEEKWDAETGIRTMVASWNNGNQHPWTDQWDADTGIKISNLNFKSSKAKRTTK